MLTKHLLTIFLTTATVITAVTANLSPSYGQGGVIIKQGLRIIQRRAVQQGTRRAVQQGTRRAVKQGTRRSVQQGIKNFSRRQQMKDAINTARDSNTEGIIIDALTPQWGENRDSNQGANYYEY